MATCGSLRHIFENTIPENSSPSSLIDSLSSSSWKHIRPLKPHVDHHSFTEIFGELHFKESPNNPLPCPSPWSPQPISHDYHEDKHDEKWDNSTSLAAPDTYKGSFHRRSDSCTEGLGSESLDDGEDLKNEVSGGWQDHNYIENNEHDYNSDNLDHRLKFNISRMGEKMHARGYSGDHSKRKNNGKTFPPPISCIGRTGKPCVCFQSYRKDGRFVLKEVKIPTHERLHASREDGRLRLSFVQPADQEDDNDDDDKVDETSQTTNEEGKEDVNALNVDVEGQGKDDVTEDNEAGKQEDEVRDDFDRGHS